MILSPRMYQPGALEPIVEVGQNVALADQTGQLSIFEVAYIESLPISAPLCVDLTLTTGGVRTTLAASTAQTAPVNMQQQCAMRDGELGHFRFRVLDHALIQFNELQSVPRGVMKFSVANFTMWSWKRDHSCADSEFFTWQYNPAFAVATNPNAVTLNQIRLALWGFRYILSGRDQQGNPGYIGANIQPLAKFQSIDALKSDPAWLNKYTFVPWTMRG